MQKVLAVYKPVCLTPNQLIDDLRLKYPEYKAQKIGFAGRLDPMAHGLMLLLIGEENKNRQSYLNLDKTYQFTVLLGLETDSYDLLGFLCSNLPNTPNLDLHQIEKFIKANIGKKIQPYPPYSTKTVAGKQLFKWAREGKINEIDIPTKEIQIYDFNFLKQSTISVTQLKQLVNSRIPKIHGFFRQDQILEKWSNFFLRVKKDSFITISFEVSCSSGTYVRTLAHNLGQELKTGALTLEIYRTKVGNFTIDDCLRL